MNLWELASILSKTLIYTGMLAVTGGMLVIWMLCARGLQAHRRVLQSLSRSCLLPLTVAGLVATCLYFLVQIGSVNQRGVTGMFDPLMGSILVDTEVGVALRWRLTGFLLALIALIPLNLPGFPFAHRTMRRVSLLMTMLAAGCFAIAIATQGHGSAVSTLAQGLAALHVLAIGCWVGALYPLYHLLMSRLKPGADELSDVDLATLMHQFGVFGWAMLGLMIVTGVGLIWLLTEGWLTLFSNLHGQLLLLKILLVSGMMALGAWHKFHWVPALLTLVNTGGDTRSTTLALARSIRLETLLALLVLLLTASLTTITGPAG